MNLVIPKAALRRMQATMHGNAGAEINSYAIGDCALGRVLIGDLHGTCSLDQPVAFAPSGR